MDDQVSLPTNPVFLSLGSNLGDRKRHLEQALELLQEASIKIEASSFTYETEPVGFKDQPDFLNLVCRATTSLEPLPLLEACKSVESRMGRRDVCPDGPRVIDIDILFRGQTSYHSSSLTIPHQSLHLRRFVLIPLAEIAPDFRHPAIGKTVRELLEDCPDRSWIRRLPSI